VRGRPCRLSAAALLAARQAGAGRALPGSGKITGGVSGRRLRATIETAELFGAERRAPPDNEPDI